MNQVRDFTDFTRDSKLFFNYSYLKNKFTD